MTSEFVTPLIVAASTLLVVAMVCAAALSAWRGWLGYKKLALTASRAPATLVEDSDQGPVGDAGALIELAAVKERLRRLEAIASGVEL